jgi:hypothetical protein
VLDLRDEIEVVLAPIMRAGHSVATGGPRYHAVTDAAVFRLIVRSLVSNALDGAAAHVDVSLARDHDRIVCTVADDGPDRSHEGLAGVSPVAKSLSIAIRAELTWNHALGWNQASLSVPAADMSGPAVAHGDPLDVRGTPRSSIEPAPASAPHLSRGEDELVTFLEVHERDRARSVTSHRRVELAGK